MAVNLKSMLLATQAAAKPMVERGGQRGPRLFRRRPSRSTPRTPPPRPASSASSAPARPLGPKGVRVNAIAHRVWTPMVERRARAAREARWARAGTSGGRRVPRQRRGALGDGPDARGGRRLDDHHTLTLTGEFSNEMSLRMRLGRMGGPMADMRKLWRFADTNGFKIISADHFQDLRIRTATAPASKRSAR